VGDKDRPFASQVVLAPSGQLKPSGKIFGPSVSQTQTQALEKEKEGKNGAESLLDLVDHRQYAKSWEEASPSFKTAVSEDKWGSYP